ncbi:hypothetical protein IG193_08510 [Infirmifilum lucidum]|uniref:QueT transporter family protein n=1 Tax=Infirmifilum lucidum TaxID=2776706 RepID=A0A7L9FJ06_9CREN|nr:hypothetical protein [Infirmifilum lucidum]QOJ78775.1 hypothetical protein IG193_08510 [Infirmifilum lucidum]
MFLPGQALSFPVAQRIPRSLRFSVLVVCSVLYALGAYATGWIVSPWGRGQFRPAVAIPAAFALIDPLAASAGAALGTLIADSWKHGTLYLPSLLAAVPGNFIGFYVFGLLLKRRSTWSGFILASLVAMALGNFIVAFLYVPVIVLLGIIPPLPPEPLLLLATGLWVWFFATEYPFLLVFIPPVAKALAASLPSITYFKPGPLTLEEGKRLATIQFLAALLLAVASIAVLFTPAGQSLARGLSVRLGATASLNALAVTGALLFASAAILSASGTASYMLATRRRLS